MRYNVATMENNKNTKKYPHTPADEAFNRAMEADEITADQVTSDSESGTVRSVTTGKEVKGVRIDAQVVSSLGGNALRPELLDGAMKNGNGEALKSALVDPKGWERQEDARANADAAEAYAAAAGRSDLANTAEMAQSNGGGVSPDQLAAMNVLNQNAARPKDPTGWERK